MSGTQATAVGRAVMSAQPYPWPYHGAFDAGRCALVACLDPAWLLAGVQRDTSDALLVRLAQWLHRAGGLVIAVTELPVRLPDGLKGAAGARLGAAVERATLLAAVGPDLKVSAGGTSAFYAGPLHAILQRGGYTDLLVAGWGLEGPVHSTLRAANDRGYECLLVPDACTSLQDGLAFGACEMVRFSGGIFGAFADTQDVLASLAGLPAGSPSETGASL